ncbi:prolyl oligopeptidase family serine peptidase [Salinarimonas soli]|uniref:Prolyl oligopeptidase family serine peptidase n=1 Tax=Salinarimonas soli TaxID=1638099 RepID=A0A5B2VBV4_9HYPH|nr:prolyl oligopeptidase family serine peptidase [Salinarimonas soli]
MSRFQSGGRAITVEWFAAEGAPASAPAVLMLHGADGLGQRGDQYRAGARALAAGGYHVGLVHYFDRTVSRWASLPAIFQNFPAWMETLRDALTFAAGQPGVDPARLGVVGISLGAALSLATAAEDTRIKALVDYFGPVPEGSLQGATRLPPTLVLHGASDPIVPVSNARALEAFLERNAVPHEVKIYPGEGHGFGRAAQGDADARVAAFLDRHLRR